ncbi:translocation/assembly module TamB domain-containing protein [Inquilinus sp. Marseille-Q2685]|uniref:translocation/assembly module TamB domain-containing protein n=1 Tax=Inquilinus sp. Marseille-Q2685 TaxID=2866581 RepID=UPI001CE49AE3|nr:translocation/assembly module TamB domain-containing protein [Inquilinus sp. Marseille-Q2685]
MRALRILLILLAVVIGLPVALLLIVFAAAQTGPGKRLIADQAGSLASSPEMQVSVGSIEGFVPFDMTVRDVAVSDPAGKMVTVDWARLAWSPTALLRRTLRVDAVEAGTVTVDRLPAGGAEPEPEPSPGGFSLPRLPVDIRLDRLNVERIAIGPAVAGMAATLSVAGDAQLGDPSQGLATNLAVRRLDGAAGDITARLAFIPSTEQLDVAVSVQEPPGGLIASMAQFPGQPPVDLKLNGTGTLRDWRATLSGKVGDLGGVEGQARIEPGEGRRRLTVDLNADAARLVPAALAATATPLLQGRTTLQAEAEITDAGPITIRQLDATAAAGSVSVTGSVNPTGNQVDLAYKLQAGAAAGFATLLPPGTGWDSLAVDGTARGALDAPVVAATIRGSGLRQAPYGAGTLAVDLTATPQGPFSDPEAPIGLRVTASADGLALGDPVLETATGHTLQFSFDGSVTQSGKAVIDRLETRLDGAVLTASGQGDAMAPSGAGTLHLTYADLGRFSGLVGQPISGALDLTVKPALAADGAATLDWNGTIAEPKAEATPTAAVLGREATLTGRIERDAGGKITVSGISVKGEKASLDAAGTLDGEAIQGTIKAALGSLAAVAPGVEGAVSVDTTLSGTIGALGVKGQVVAEGVKTAGHAVEHLTVDIDAAGLPSAPAGTVKLAGTVDGKPATGNIALAQGPNGGFDLNPLVLDVAGIKADGNAAVAADGKPVGGTVRLAVADLGVVGAFIGQALRGQLDATLSLDPTAGAKIDLTARRVAYADTAQLGEIRLTGTVLDPMADGRRIQDGRLLITNATASGTPISRAELTVAGTMQQLALKLQAATGYGTADMAADIGLNGGETVVGLKSLAIRQSGQSVTLSKPATIRAGAAGVDLGTIDLAVSGGGTVSLSGRAGDALDLRARIARLPLGLASIASPGLELQGRLDGDATITGSAADPGGKFSLKVSGAKMGGLNTAGLPTVDATADGTLGGRRVAVTSRVTAGRARLDLQGAVPLGGGPLSASAKGQVELAMFNDFLAAGADRIGGPLSLDIRIEGTPDRPQASGTVTLRNGSYQNSEYGVRLQNIDATVTGAGDSFRLSSLSAKTPGGGTISGSGSVTLGAGGSMPIDVRIQTSNALLVSSDLATVHADSDLTMSGDLSADSLLKGSVKLRQAVIQIPDSFPVSVTPIPVRQINAPPEIAARLKDQQPPPAARQASARAPRRAEPQKPPSQIGLDITVEAPNQLYVRGQGIDAEMQGQIHVVGTTSTPDIQGGFEMRRGAISKFGQRLDFERGRITFDGGVMTDPRLDFLASSRAGDVVAHILVGGYASKPELTLSSTPELPQDEVLSRLLFGQATGQLSPSQAIQLAQAAAELAGVGGGGTGLLGGIQKSLGLDQLDFNTDASGGSAIGLGRYLTKGVRVGVEQGIDAGSTRATVTIDVTDNIKGKAEAGGDSGGAVGGTVEWDY